MLDKLEKIEEKINEGLGKVFKKLSSLLLRFFSAIIPKFIKNFYLKVKNNALSTKKASLKITQTKWESAKVFITDKKTRFFKKIDDIQNFPVKEKGIEKALEFKTFLIETSPQQHKENLKLLIKKILERVKTKLSFVKSNYFKIGTGLALLSLLGFYAVYLGSNNIFQTEFPSRKIASVQEYDYRPDYRFYENKVLRIQNVKVPIFVEEIGDIDSITIDFSLRVSTKFAKYYLEEYEYRLKDYFFTSVEPVSSDFPIQDEGKEVLKEAIQDEINNFLYDNNVEGEVLEVNILYMVGS